MHCASVCMSLSTSCLAFTIMSSTGSCSIFNTSDGVHADNNTDLYYSKQSMKIINSHIDSIYLNTILSATFFLVF